MREAQCTARVKLYNVVVQHIVNFSLVSKNEEVMGEDNSVAPIILYSLTLAYYCQNLYTLKALINRFFKLL